MSTNHLTYLCDKLAEDTLAEDTLAVRVSLSLSPSLAVNVSSRACLGIHFCNKKNYMPEKNFSIHIIRNAIQTLMGSQEGSGQVTGVFDSPKGHIKL